MTPMELRSHTSWLKGPRWLGSKEKKIMEFVDVPLASMESGDAEVGSANLMYYTPLNTLSSCLEDISLPSLQTFVGLPYRASPPPPLPLFRVTEQPPFTLTGVDFAGPLLVRADHPLHAPWEQKSFIRPFKRFTSRRGLPHKMISDNASSFKLAASVIKQVVTDPTILKYLSGLRVEWCNYLKKAPWLGGIYEGIISMTKRCLCKVV
uniref:Integrase catalytic domain-containing protein n=1 Tax=Amphimedon queenslandica TaxID=400682 RepID=A0A1X7UJS9_AMPQE